MEDLDKLVFFLPSGDHFIQELYASLRGEHVRSFLIKSGVHIRVARELVNPCVDDVYTEILLDSPELRARKELPNGNILYIKLEDLGGGIEKAIIVALWLEALKPKLVLWDDFEASSHPSLIRTMISWLADHDWQVVLATHSLDVLYGLLDVEPKNAQVILLCKTADDEIRADYMSLDELEDLLEAGQDPRYLVEVLKL